MTETVRTERQGSILIITIDRPQVRNAIDGPTARALTDAVDAFETDSSLLVGILTGAGGHFSAGADLKVAAREGDSGARTERGPMGMCMHPPSKPMIAAIEGAAVGGGLELALACDLIVAAEDARVGLPEVRRNLIAMGGGLLRLPQRLPAGLAAEMALTGALYSAADIYHFGLINRLAVPGEALTEALVLARTIVSNGSAAVAATKTILRDAPGWPYEERWTRQRETARKALEKPPSLVLKA